MKNTVYCVIPNWNGKAMLGTCLDSLQKQSHSCSIVVVDNGSTDGSQVFIKEKYPEVHLIELDKNYGFVGGVNPGIKYAMEQEAEFVALFNNDAIADPNWLKGLLEGMEKHPNVGIVMGKVVNEDGTHYDSTGDLYTTWAYPYSRGGHEPLSTAYDEEAFVFGANGGAALFRTRLFEDIGLFDEAFFAYLDDVDMSFRAQLAGWKVLFTPAALVNHGISKTGNRVKGLKMYNVQKNIAIVFWKNVPLRLFPIILPRFTILYLALIVGAFKKGEGYYALKGAFKAFVLFPDTLLKRRKIQKQRRVSSDYIASILTWDLPPHTNKLHRLRSIWRKIRLNKEGNS